MRPFYRVVVIDERSKRNGAYIELLGTYNPLTEPKDIKLKQDRIDHWVKMGAQKSVGFLRIIGKAPQRLPRKPKKLARNASPARQSPDGSSRMADGQSDAGGEKKAPQEPVPAAAEPKAEEKTPTEEPAPTVEEIKTEEVIAESPSEEAPIEQKEDVIPSSNEESQDSSHTESGDSSPAEPVQNDKKEEEAKNEGSA